MRKYTARRDPATGFGAVEQHGPTKAGNRETRPIKKVAAANEIRFLKRRAPKGAGGLRSGGKYA